MTNFLGLKILEEKESPINGKIQVVSDTLGRISIRAGSLTQSGGVVVEAGWRATLNKVKKLNLKVEKCLLLGVGGGTAAKLVNELWPGASILGVDIDPIMVELGEKYMGLGKISNFKTKIADATSFVFELRQQKSKFNLILVDLFQQDRVPPKAERDKFIKTVRELLVPGGIVVFNRLFYDGKKENALQFREKLRFFFSSITAIYPEANILFICRENTV